MRIRQEPVRLDSHGCRLHGIYYQPDQLQSPPAAAIVCDPFAEEKKCSQRILAQMSRQMATLGIAVLHCDYRGTGDSAGNFFDFGPTDWLEDIEAAVAHIRGRLPGVQIGLLGLRLGASLAAQACEQIAECRWLVLWEPVTNGRRFAKETLRRSIIKAMLTAGEDFSAETVKAGGEREWFDLDGYRVAAQTRAELEAIDLSGAREYTGPVLAVNIAARPRVAPDLLALADNYEGGRSEVVVMEPFWSRVGLVNAERLVELTEQWLRVTI